MLWRAISLILCLQTLLMPFAGVWRRLLRYSWPRKRISPFSVFSTAASETTTQKTTSAALAEATTEQTTK